MKPFFLKASSLFKFIVAVFFLLDYLDKIERFSEDLLPFITNKSTAMMFSALLGGVLAMALACSLIRAFFKTTLMPHDVFMLALALLALLLLAHLSKPYFLEHAGAYLVPVFLFELAFALVSIGAIFLWRTYRTKQQ